jgi:D-lactate dehydrogenase
MLLFDFRESEKNFFEENNLENLDIKFFKESLTEETLTKLSDEDFEETMIISVFIDSVLNEKIISRFKNLRVISTRSTGYDHICVKTCANKNIALINVESYGSKSVGQFAIAIILMLVRNIYPALKTQFDEKIQYTDFCGRDLNDLTIGVIGTGATGAAVCHLAKSLGMKILANDIRPRNELINNLKLQYVDLETLLKNSDIVTLHLPYTKDNYHMFSTHEFELMKDGAYFVNVARGELVDTETLLEFAKKGKFSGIGLDVVACPNIETKEDVIAKERSSILCLETSNTVQELSKLNNVILTPHMAYDTQDSVNYILKVTFEGIADYMTGGHKYRII